jgi:F-type H+-transporting ATPase subunit delta
MARRTTAARRYAEAAFEIASRDGTTDAWLIGLSSAARVLGDPQVMPVVANPALPLANRLSAVRTLLTIERLREAASVAIGGDMRLRDRLAVAGAGLDRRVGAQIVNLVELLLQRGRIDQVGRIADEYQRLFKAANGIVTAAVSSATALTDDEIAAVRGRVEEMTGAAVDLRLDIEPALIGGLTVRIGDRLIDASVRGRLERLREQLVQGAR